MDLRVGERVLLTIIGLALVWLWMTREGSGPPADTDATSDQDIEGSLHVLQKDGKHGDKKSAS